MEFSELHLDRPIAYVELNEGSATFPYLFDLLVVLHYVSMRIPKRGRRVKLIVVRRIVPKLRSKENESAVGSNSYCDKCAMIALITRYSR